MKTEINSTYEYDLMIGKASEIRVADVLQLTEEKIENKYERRTCYTGNIFLEFESKGRPSGIATTKAKYYIFEFGEEWEGIMLIFSVEKLKTMARKFYQRDGYKTGGDNKSTKGVLIPVKELLDSDSELVMPESEWECNRSRQKPTPQKNLEPQEENILTLEKFLALD